MIYKLNIRVLSRAYIPDDIKYAITGPVFALYPYDYIQFKKLWMYGSLIEHFNFELDNSILEDFNIKSNSTIYNANSFISIFAIWIVIHLFIFFI